MEAIVLAGGLGNRLRPVVSDVPKPMAPVNGRPFLEHLLDYWISQGVDRFVLSVGYKHKVIEKHFGARYRSAAIDYAVEAKPCGTGGGLLLSLPRLRGPGTFLVMNGDTFFAIELDALRHFHRDRQADLTVALRELAGNDRYGGVGIDEQGRITTFDNRARTPGRALINGGVYLAEKKAFTGMIPEPDGPVSLEEQLYARMLASGRRLYGWQSPGRFIDIGIPEDYHRAASILQGD